LRVFGIRDVGRDLISVPVLSIANNSSLSGVYKHTLAFFASACLAILATVFTLTGAALWTTAINTSESVNGLILNTTNIPLGIEVSSGSGLSLLWAAVGLLIASLVPYLIRSDSPFCLAPTKRLIWVSFFLQLLHLPRLGGYNHISSVFRFLSSSFT
jgi:hypothetical protein